MSPKKPIDDYNDFLESSESHSAIQPDLSKIKNDLVPSAWHLAAWYSGFSVVGYLASLMICAQNSLGLSGFAHHVAQAIHSLPDPWCPMICGAVFTGVPFVLSTVLLNRFQHRYLIFKMWWFFAAIPIVGTISMILLPQSFQHQRLAKHMSELAARPHALSDAGWMTVWALTAIVFPYLLEIVVWKIVAPRKQKNRTLSSGANV
jgi:hypothetical protein